MSEDIVSPACKVCSKCKVSKPLSAFGKHKQCKYGRRSACRSCTKASSADYYIKHKAQINARNSAWARANPEMVQECSRRHEATRTRDPADQRRSAARHAKANPLKIIARNKMTWAIESGAIVRQPCEVCGEERTDGHHDDYAKPLEVRFLCRKHHAQWHAANGPGLNG